MNAAAGEVPDWSMPNGRFGLHHPIVHGDIAYCSWRDACLAIVDVSDRHDPRLIARKVWSPPFGGGTHNALPLPGRDLLVVVDETVLDHQEDGFKPVWIFNNAVKGNPISIATCPPPDDSDYLAVGGHFGPHNIHENRPGTFISEELIFVTYQNAGVRAYDIRDPFRPREPAARSFRRRRAGWSIRGPTGRSRPPQRRCACRSQRPRLLHRLQRRSLHRRIHAGPVMPHPDILPSNT